MARVLAPVRFAISPTRIRPSALRTRFKLNLDISVKVKGIYISTMTRPCALLLVVALAACQSLRPSHSPETLRVRVLVYNIHAGKDASMRDNIGRVAAVVKSTNADI